MALNHGDKKSLEKKNEFRGIPIVSQCGIQAAGLQSETRRQALTVRMRHKPDAETTSNKQILCLVGEIHSGLQSDVYNQVLIDVIKDTKLILDLPPLAAKLHQPEGGSIKVAEIDFPIFMKAVLAIPVRSLHSVPEQTLKEQYSEFLKRLEAFNIPLHIGTSQSSESKRAYKEVFQPYRQSI